MIYDKLRNKKLAKALSTGILTLLLATAALAQGPLDLGSSENCTTCLGNASADPIAPAPGAATLISPSGIINSGSPTYTWTGAAGCQFYGLVVKNHLGAVVFKQWYSASDFPPAPASCSVTPAKVLDAGDYKWSVICSNCLISDPSSEMAFTVCSSSSLPGKATLISPRDIVGTKNPTFFWNAVPVCTQYCLKLVDIANQNVALFEHCYNAQEVLSGQVCSVTPGLNLPVGSYRWWIQTVNCKGNGPLSNYLSFTYQAQLPGRPNPISPRGLVSSCQPTFTWSSVSGATKYHLQVDNDNTNIMDFWFDAAVVTNGYRCSVVLPDSLPSDDVDYFWRIQASNDAGVSPWSSYRYFEVVCGCKKTAAKRAARLR
jgi:hypothetical protein